MYPNETTRAYICYHKTVSTQSKKGAKFTHKIKFTKLRFLSDTSRARHDAQYKTVELTVKIYLRHCSRAIQLCNLKVGQIM